jgi:hypothetical protein
MHYQPLLVTPHFPRFLPLSKRARSKPSDERWHGASLISPVAGPPPGNMHEHKQSF